MPSAGVVGSSARPGWAGWATSCAFLFILAGAAFRLAAYGDVRASLATMDTPSYMAHAGAMGIDGATFSGERLFTTGLLYRLWRAQAYLLDFVSIPAIGREATPGIQACFVGIALTQALLFLALVLTFFADSIGVERHVMPAIVLFRLLLWAGMATVLDPALESHRPVPTV